MVCKMYNNNGIVEHYYSTGKVTPGYLKPDDPTVGITDATVTYENGKLFCKFTREKTIEGVNRYCNLNNNNYFLQIVEGQVSNSIKKFSLLQSPNLMVFFNLDEIQNHGQSFVISDTKIDFSINGTFSGSTRDSAKAKAHGNLTTFFYFFKERKFYLKNDKLKSVLN